MKRLYRVGAFHEADPRRELQAFAQRAKEIATDTTNTLEVFEAALAIAARKNLELITGEADDFTTAQLVDCYLSQALRILSSEKDG